MKGGGNMERGRLRSCLDGGESGLGMRGSYKGSCGGPWRRHRRQPCGQWAKHILVGGQGTMYMKSVAGSLLWLGWGGCKNGHGGQYRILTRSLYHCILFVWVVIWLTVWTIDLEGCSTGGKQQAIKNFEDVWSWRWWGIWQWFRRWW